MLLHMYKHVHADTYTYVHIYIFAHVYANMLTRIYLVCAGEVTTVPRRHVRQRTSSDDDADAEDADDVQG